MTLRYSTAKACYKEQTPDVCMFTSGLFTWYEPFASMCNRSNLGPTLLGIWAKQPDIYRQIALLQLLYHFLLPCNSEVIIAAFGAAKGHLDKNLLINCLLWTVLWLIWIVHNLATQILFLWMAWNWSVKCQ